MEEPAPPEPTPTRAELAADLERGAVDLLGEAVGHLAIAAPEMADGMKAERLTAIATARAVIAIPQRLASIDDTLGDLVSAVENLDQGIRR